VAAWAFRVVGFLLGFSFGLSLGVSVWLWLSLGFLGWVFLCTRVWWVCLSLVGS
jgi:hypothetical protein